MKAEQILSGKRRLNVGPGCVEFDCGRRRFGWLYLFLVMFGYPGLLVLGALWITNPGFGVQWPLGYALLLVGVHWFLHLTKMHGDHHQVLLQRSQKDGILRFAVRYGRKEVLADTIPPFRLRLVPIRVEPGPGGYGPVQGYGIELAAAEPSDEHTLVRAEWDDRELFFSNDRKEVEAIADALAAWLGTEIER